VALQQRATTESYSKGEGFKGDLIEQQVAKLEVSVDHTHTVKVSQPIEQLKHEVLDLSM